eukprot:1441262-Amphidinium_carterae.1
MLDVQEEGQPEGHSMTFSNDSNQTERSQNDIRTKRPPRMFSVSVIASLFDLDRQHFWKGIISRGVTKMRCATELIAAN